jgi:hypothetical protein
VKTTIAARLDVLPPTARSVLLDAAVVGKVFWRGALAAIENGHRADDLEDALDLLEARDFVRRESTSQIQGDREYTFKHMLIREVAYATLPRGARRDRHAAVARFIEQSAGERIGEAAAILAHHWREAGDDERALEFLIQAAEHAALGWAKGEAVTLYAQALELIPEEGQARRRGVALKRAMTLVEIGDLASGIPLLDEILPHLEGRDRLEALLSRGRAAFWGMDAPTVRKLSLEAHELAQSLGEQELVGPALALRSEAESMEGRMIPAFELGHEAAAIWKPGTRDMDYAQFLDQMSLDRYWTGEYAAAEEIARKVLTIAEEIKSTDALLRTGAVLGVILTAQGRHEEARVRAAVDGSVAEHVECPLSGRVRPGRGSTAE